MESYIGHVVAGQNSLLIGGAKRHESARFETYGQAYDWADAVRKLNDRTGHCILYFGVHGCCLECEIAKNGDWYSNVSYLLQASNV